MVSSLQLIRTVQTKSLKPGPQCQRWVTLMTLALVMTITCMPAAGSEAERERIELLRGEEVKVGTLSGKWARVLAPLTTSVDPKVRAEAMQMLGALQVGQGNFSAALSTFEACTLVPGAPSEVVGLARLGMAQACAGSVRHSEGMAILNDLIAATSGHDEILPILAARDLARLQLTQGSLAEAEKTAEWAIEMEKRRYKGSSSDMGLMQVKEAELHDLLAQIRDALLEKNQGRDAMLFAQAMRRYVVADYAASRLLFAAIAKDHCKGKFAAESAFMAIDSRRRAGDWRGARTEFEAFIDADPGGAFRGQAAVELCDGLLAEDLLPDVASRRIASAIDHLALATHPSWSAAKSALHLRRGVLLLLDKDQKAAGEAFIIARDCQGESPWGPPPEGMKAIPTPAEALIEACRGGAEIVPSAAMVAKNTKANLVLVLGQLAFISREWDLARRFFERIERPDIKANRDQIAFATFRLSEVHHWSSRPVEAVACYDRLIGDFAKTQWSASAAIRKAIAQHCQLGQPEAASATLVELLRTQPRCEEKPSALWMLATFARWDGRNEAAITAYNRLLSEFPDNPWKELIVTDLLPSLKKP